MRIHDKVIVIVGGASELATATGTGAIEDGARVVLVHHNQASLDRVLPAYEGAEVATEIADVTNLEQLQTAFGAIIERYGRIDALVNCAGITRHNPIEAMSAEDWQQVIDVNLTGAFNVCKAVTPLMKAAQKGNIVNVASVGGRTGRPGVGVNYAASKAGMIGLTQTLARELAADNIVVNAVAPGPLAGRMFFGMQLQSQEKLTAGIPLGRVGTMAEVSGAILFLASDDAAWITGQTLDVNGGVYM